MRTTARGSRTFGFRISTLGLAVFALAGPSMVAADRGAEADRRTATVGMRRFDVLSVESIPPALPSEGDRFLVGPFAVGAFDAHEDEIARWLGGVWTFIAPIAGDQAFDAEADRQLVFTDRFQGAAGIWVDSKWVELTPTLPKWRNGGTIGSSRTIVVTDHRAWFIVTTSGLTITLPDITAENGIAQGMEVIIEIGNSIGGTTTIALPGLGIIRDSDGSEHLGGSLPVFHASGESSDVLHLTAGNSGSDGTWFIARPYGLPR